MSARAASTKTVVNQLELSFTGSADVRVTRMPGGVVQLTPVAPLVEGTVRDAMRVLGRKSRDAIYDLIESGEITGWKVNPNASNAHYTIDMTTVYELKTRQKEA